MTEQITCFLLPSIADRSASFPFVYLLEALLTLLSKPEDSGGNNKGVTPTPWLLYGVLAFVYKHLGRYRISILTNIFFCFGGGGALGPHQDA